MNEKGEYVNCKRAIEDFYGDRVAERSGVRLINHINEGCAILSAKFGCSPFSPVCSAFSIHPLVQNCENVDLTHIDCEILDMAHIYKEFANSYLCSTGTDHIESNFDLHKGFCIKGYNLRSYQAVAKMLWADKVQNRKDFLIYHQSSHPRSRQLNRYFNIWIEYLEDCINLDDDSFNQKYGGNNV